jgi:DNA-binding response OmpR family regulator
MKRILLADDDLTMVALLKTLLNMEGYHVSTLLDKSGDILKNIRRARPDVVLIDIILGDRNGLDILRQIRQVPALKRVKVIMVSGVDKTEECLAAGADVFLLKPYMPNVLLDLLRE